jgi:heptaprenylglyceryl phosphate synthase
LIQLIVDGRELTNISEAAKEYFYSLVLNSKEGPFVCQTLNSTTKAIVLLDKEQPQTELF